MNYATINLTMRGFALMTALAAFTTTASASASPSFPAALREAADLDCTPSCLACHETDPGVSGNTNDFGSAMFLAGLVPRDPDTLAAALEELRSDDSMGAAGAGSVVPAEFPCSADVTYGCGVSAPQKPDDASRWWVPLLLSAGGVLVFARRRRA